MKQINAGVNMDISFQMYSNLHFMDWKWLNMPYIACKTNADIESMFGTCLYHEICIKKRMLMPSNERWAAHPPPPAFPLVGVYLHSIFPFSVVVSAFLTATSTTGLHSLTWWSSHDKQKGDTATYWHSAFLSLSATTQVPRRIFYKGP